MSTIIGSPEHFGPREPIADSAASRLSGLLQAELSEADVACLKEEGALLTEDQATALALRF